LDLAQRFNGSRKEQKVNRQAADFNSIDFAVDKLGSDLFVTSNKDVMANQIYLNGLKSPKNAAYSLLMPEFNDSKYFQASMNLQLSRKVNKKQSAQNVGQNDRRNLLDLSDMHANVKISKERMF
jgi:formylmethanofuran dehydrogenase subunit E-like metal-binding protein